jgi:ATP synthase A1 C subunit
LIEADYQELLARVTLEELITALTETPYKEDIEAALLRTAGVGCVYEAVRANLTRALQQMYQFYTGEPRALVALLLRRWDRHNLLTILRGQSQMVSSEEMMSVLIPVGQFDRVALRELARQPGLPAVIDLMTTWRLPYASVLRHIQARTGTTPDLDQLELALNRFHYAAIRAELEKGNHNRLLALEYFRTEVDLINLSATLRLAQQPEIWPLLRQRYQADNIRPLLIEPGGHLPPQRLVELAATAGGVEGVVHGLSDSPYGRALERGWQRYQAGQAGLSVLERELERWQAEQSRLMFTRDPLSIAIPIGYITSKEVEIANLRLIAQAVALNLKRDEVQHELIILH